MPLAFRARLELIKAVEDSAFDSLRHRWHRDLLIVQGQVVQNILTILVHPLHSVLNNDGEFVSERRIVGHQVWNGACQKQTVSVFMLEPLAIESRPARCRSEQKSFGHHISSQ